MNIAEKDFEKITKKLIPNLLNINNKNSQLIITFAGIPSSGKTTIAKRLEKKYKALRINGDIIYDIAEELGLALDYWDLERIKRNYVLAFLESNPFKNKLIILDKGMDRMYKDFINLCKRNKLNYFIISLSLSKKDAIKRFKKRNPKTWKTWLTKLGRWSKENTQFKRDVSSNIVIDANKINYKEICKEINKELEKIKNESKART
ncbi:AAA family ATPase [Candidatus Pacearchaeota archaeon]|nr:AAA family ATPase [Candidatus Pacearchaeota archaeon]